MTDTKFILGRGVRVGSLIGGIMAWFALAFIVPHQPNTTLTLIGYSAFVLLSGLLLTQTITLL